MHFWIFRGPRIGEESEKRMALRSLAREKRRAVFLEEQGKASESRVRGVKLLMRFVSLSTLNSFLKSFV
jgi:hypothetical protein